MASLRQTYEEWMDNEPEEIDDDRPNVEQMAAFAESEKKHAEQVNHPMTSVDLFCFESYIVHAYSFCNSPICCSTL